MRPRKHKKQDNSILFTFHDDFPEYFETQPGKGQFSQSTFQQISVAGDENNQNETDDNIQGDLKEQNNNIESNQVQFHLDQGIPYENASSIKTYQFNSGMFAPSKINKIVDESPPEVQIKLKELSGHNSKYRMNCVLIDQGCYCLSIGCNVVLCPLRKSQRAKDRKMYQEHQFQVSHLCYSRKYKYLVSGSKGLKPEIILWSYEQNSKFQQCSISFVNRFYLPRKSEAVGLLVLASESILVCVDSVSMHRSNSIYLFDIEMGNQLQPSSGVSHKIFDIFVRDGGDLLIASDRGVYRMQLSGQKKLVKFGNMDHQIVSVEGFKDKVLMGDRLGNIFVVSDKGVTISKISVHKCCVYLIKVIVKDSLVLSSQVEENVIKINRIVESGGKIELQCLQTLQFNSYCTAIDYINNGNILIGMRDGNIILYDSVKKVRKFEKKPMVSYLERQKESFFIYNKINQRFILKAKRNILCQISPDNLVNECIITKFSKKSNCIWLNRDKVIQVFHKKDGNIQVQIRSLTDIEAEPQQQFSLSCPQAGKPKIVRFNEDVIAIGTKLGFIIVHCIKSSLTMVSPVTHKAEVEEIIFQEGEWKQGQKYFLKSVCESELYYWQVEGKEGKIKKVSKAWSVKNVQWCDICKYGWETRNIWEQMTHFEDISSVALVAEKYICISMWNGVLRVYRFPASANNYVEYKIFPGKFLLSFNGSTQNPLLGCLSKCCIMLLKLTEINISCEHQ